MLRRRLERRAQAGLQLSQGPAEPRRRAAAGAAAAKRSSAIRRAGRASISAAAARSSAASARSSTSRAARAGSAPPTTSRRSSARIIAQGIKAFFITDDNLARNKRLGGVLRPADPAARGGGAQGQPHHPGRHALPPHPELHRQGDARRRDAGLHRPREHQSGQSARRQQAPEQDHRISPHAPAMARARRLHCSPATSSASPATPRNRSSATSRSSSASCRSTCSNSSS